MDCATQGQRIDCGVWGDGNSVQLEIGPGEHPTALFTDETVPARHRGTYLAFAHEQTDGMRHLRRLADSGMNSLHLLPTNDIATIEEDRSRQQEPQCDLPSFPPDSEAQQACISPVRDLDGFNWGYDPLHYTTPARASSARWSRPSTAPACAW